MPMLMNYGVQPLSAQEVENTDGGGWWPLIALVIAAINDAQNNPDDFKAGYDSVFKDH